MQEEIFKCNQCGAEFDTKQKLGAHKAHCDRKIEEQEARRKERVPFGVPIQRFTDLPDTDRYHYRVFNDNWRKEPGRILRAKRAGYEECDHIQSPLMTPVTPHMPL